MTRADDRRGGWTRKDRDPPVIAGRVPPHDLDSEAAVLSAAMLDLDALDDALELLEPEHFYSDANRLIFEAAKELRQKGTPVDVITIGRQLRAREQIQRAGGTTYLGQIVDATPATAHVTAHAKTVHECWRLRRTIATCQRFAAEGYGDVGDPGEFIDELETEVFGLAHLSDLDGGPTLIAGELTTAFNELAEASDSGTGIIGTSTGYPDLDQKTAGIHRGDLMVLAARPGMGKTAFVLNVAANIASPKVMHQAQLNLERDVTVPGEGVAVFSLEMPKKQLAIRMACSEARVDLQKLRTGHMDKDDWMKLTAGADALAPLPIYLDDRPNLTPLQIRAAVRRLQSAIARRAHEKDRPKNLGLVVIDYLQLMGGKRARNESREEQIASYSRALKQLAKECDVPVIALSQLNRGVETRGIKDKRPLMSDLRESGAIEQDADMIVFIYRDEYYNRDSTERGIAELIISKQRNGPTGTVKVRFTSQYARFDTLAPTYDHPDLPEERLPYAD